MWSVRRQCGSAAKKHLIGAGVFKCYRESKHCLAVLYWKTRAEPKLA